MVEEPQVQLGCGFPRPTGRGEPVDERLGVNDRFCPESSDDELAPRLSFLAVERERLAGGIRERVETIPYVYGQVGKEGILGSGDPNVRTSRPRSGNNAFIQKSAHLVPRVRDAGLAGRIWRFCEPHPAAPQLRFPGPFDTEYDSDVGRSSVEGIPAGSRLDHRYIREQILPC